MISKTSLHIPGERRFVLWQKMASKLLFAHSNFPLSRENPNVKSVVTIGTLTFLRKLMKLAMKMLVDALPGHL